MWGKLLVFGIGAAVGAIGKMIYDESQSAPVPRFHSNENATSSDPGPDKNANPDFDPADLRAVSDEVVRLGTELNDLKSSAKNALWDETGKPVDDFTAKMVLLKDTVENKESELKAAEKHLAELTAMAEKAKQAAPEPEEANCTVPFGGGEPLTA